MKTRLILFFALLQCTTVFAQLSEGGTPASFKYPSMLRSSKSVYTSSLNVDVKRLLWEDSITEKNGSPIRVATTVPVNIDIRKSGDWKTLPDGQKIWTISINLPEAAGIITSYNELYIPEGGKLFVYNKDKTQVLGAFTHATNSTGGAFSNAAIMGDEIVLEYDAPMLGNDADMPRLQIANLGYIYRSKFNAGLKGLSSSCEININCPQGDNWQKEKRGVVKILMNFDTGWYMCSGSLINNTKQDGTPYLLTASHCFIDENGSKADVTTAQFIFNYETPGCDASNLINDSTLVGSEMKVLIPMDGGSDGVLLKLTNSIPLTYKPYFNGWDRTNTPATGGVVIHHPAGDVKKISMYNTPTQSTNLDTGQGITAPNSDWAVVYSGGVTEPGSSGSPLFNQNKLIIGTLTGGGSSCSSPNTPDGYGKLWYHWDQYSDVTQHMGTYLDPLKLGVLSLNGYEPTSVPDSIVPDSISSKILVFPSPFKNELHINTTSIIRSIQIVSLNGHSVYQKSNYDASTITIDTSNWPEGVYALKIKTDTGYMRSKAIK